MKRDEKLKFSLTLACLGVVFGDIGTSPLYALKECFAGEFPIPAHNMEVFGVLSLTFWSLITIISIKYCLIVLRADNQGEGGILALLTLFFPHLKNKNRFIRNIVFATGLFGACLLYGDGMITPAISVLSAIEGLEVVSPQMSEYVVYITIAILFVLFFFQKFGTQKIGNVFGPIVMTWLLYIGLIGGLELVKSPEILQAINPYYGFDFIRKYGFDSLYPLGALFLTITGAEAMYADMGHFGRKSIVSSWLAFVLPCLLLNYFGQGALILRDPKALANPFFHLVPEGFLYITIFLATLATIVASQAVITGAFSLTQQAIRLGVFPRMIINHTSKTEKGQIYVAKINWLLLFSTIILVLTFKQSGKLAAAYGIAVSTAMLITTFFLIYTSLKLWGWNKFLLLVFGILFIVIDISFLAANSLKFVSGGWIPIFVGSALLFIMLTWRRGREIVLDRVTEGELDFNQTEDFIIENKGNEVDGTAIYMVGKIQGIPPALFVNLKFNHVIHKYVLIVKVNVLDRPYVYEEDRFDFKPINKRISQVNLYFGFLDAMSIPHALEKLSKINPELILKNEVYILGRETLLATVRPGMAIWREKFFAFLSRNSQRADEYFKIPPGKVVEIGQQIEL